MIHYLAGQPTAPDGLTWAHALPDGAAALAAELGGSAVSADLAEPDAATHLLDAVGHVDVLVKPCHLNAARPGAS